MHITKYFGIRSIFLWFIFIFFSSFVVFSDTIKEQIQKDIFLMAEGIGGAGFLLNTNKVEVIKRLGRPARFMFANQVFKTTKLPFKAREILLYKNPKRIFVFYNNRLQAIIVDNDANWHTLLGVNIKTSLTTIIEKYGYNYQKEGQDIIYSEIGIAFFIEGSKVKGMAIFPPKD
jgi:hypothetical protein